MKGKCFRFGYLSVTCFIPRQVNNVYVGLTGFTYYTQCTLLQFFDLKINFERDAFNI